MSSGGTSLLKLGTRKSLLALSQSQWVAKQVELLNPGITVELVGIETQGDKILDKPLSQIEGKEFFTAELDHALLRGEVDFTVHSMKDLSLERPPQFTLAAVPKRELPHDVILFNEKVIDRLRQGLPLRVGTSSPRRLTLVPDFLSQALPQFGSTPKFEFHQIRGNVNTRLSRIHEAEGTEKKLDAVVLAFAGLERLSLNPQANAELQKLLKGTRMMLVPVRAFPTAPAQGALAVECRTDRPEIRALLSKLHHEDTLAAVRSEREILQEWGGGCHQKLGATLVAGSLFIAGTKPSGQSVNQIRGPDHESRLLPDHCVRIEARDVFDFKAVEAKIPTTATFVFVAHFRALEHLEPSQLQLLRDNSPTQRVWVSGMSSWKKLATQGIWVEGCLEGEGFHSLEALRQKALLRIGAANFLFLSHRESGNNPGATLLATYQHQFREVPQKIWKSDAIYWSSGLPFDAIWSTLKSTNFTEQDRQAFQKKHHYCGPGKTADRIRSLGFEPVLFRGDS